MIIKPNQISPALFPNVIIHKVRYIYVPYYVPSETIPGRLDCGTSDPTPSTKLGWQYLRQDATKIK